MKKLMILASVCFSLNAFSTEKEVVGCLNPMSSTKSYNALFDVTYNRLNSYTIEIDGELHEEELITEEREVGPLYIKYAELAGNMYGYKVAITKDLMKNWNVSSWKSTTYIDDYTVEEGQELVVCHLLKNAPSSMEVSAKNIAQKIQ